MWDAREAREKREKRKGTMMKIRISALLLTIALATSVAAQNIETEKLGNSIDKLKI